MWGSTSAVLKHGEAHLLVPIRTKSSLRDESTVKWIECIGGAVVDSIRFCRLAVEIVVCIESQAGTISTGDVPFLAQLLSPI